MQNASTGEDREILGTEKQKIIQKPWVTRNRVLKVIMKKASPERCHSIKSCNNTNSVLTQREESCFLSHWCHHLCTKALPTIGLVCSNLLLSFETIISDPCSGRETCCKTNEGWVIMFCDLWSVHIPTVKSYSAFTFLLYLLPTFTWFSTWGKVAEAAAGPDLWWGVVAICSLSSLLLPGRREAEFCLSCLKQGVLTPASLSI